MSLTQIYRHYQTEPETALGNWLRQSALKRILTFLFLFLLLSIFPVSQWAENYMQWKEMKQNQKNTAEDLAQQEKILQVLQQKNHSARLSPEKMQKLLPINQQLQNIAQQYPKLKLQFTNWKQQNVPTLQIQFQGYFSQIYPFLTALSAQLPQLALSALHIEKTEQTEFSIQGQFTFLLTTGS